MADTCQHGMPTPLRGHDEGCYAVHELRRSHGEYLAKSRLHVQRTTAGQRRPTTVCYGHAETVFRPSKSRRRRPSAVLQSVSVVVT